MLPDGRIALVISMPGPWCERARDAAIPRDGRSHLTRLFGSILLCCLRMRAVHGDDIHRSRQWYQYRRFSR